MNTSAHRRISHALPDSVSLSLSVSDIGHVEANLEVFRAVRDWIRSYLARPHSELGRTGAVCPFAPAALAKDTFRVAVVRFKSGDKRAQILNALNYYRESFLASKGTEEERLLHSTLIVFPDVSISEAPDLIDGMKEYLKESFVQQGLMLGEFHEENQSPGLHNPHFKPLRSQIPMLVIRRMVATDLVFLNRSTYDPHIRLRYLNAYLRVPGIPDSNRREVESAISAIKNGKR